MCQPLSLSTPLPSLLWALSLLGMTFSFHVTNTPVRVHQLKMQSHLLAVGCIETAGGLDLPHGQRAGSWHPSTVAWGAGARFIAGWSM